MKRLKDWVAVVLGMGVVATGRGLVVLGMGLSVLVGCRLFDANFWLEKSEYSDAEASAAEAAELEYFAKRQLSTGEFSGPSRLLSTALVLRCFLEASITPGDSRHGRTVEAGLDWLIRQVEGLARPIVHEDEAVELRVAIWTLAMAYGETKNPNLLSAIRVGVSRLNQWNGRKQFSSAHTKYDDYQRMGMESLIMLELRSAGIGCKGSVFAETLEKAVRGADRQEWFNGVSALRLAFDVYGIDPVEESFHTGVMHGMRMCSLPPTEMSPDHYRVVQRLCHWRCVERHRCQFKPPQSKEEVSKELVQALEALERKWLEEWREDMKYHRASSINHLRKLKRSTAWGTVFSSKSSIREEEEAIREAALLVLEMPRPQWGWYFRRPFPNPEVDLVPSRGPRKEGGGVVSGKKEVAVEVNL